MPTESGKELNLELSESRVTILSTRKNRILQQSVHKEEQ